MCIRDRYNVDGLEVEIPVPPADFEPLEASNEELEEYGIPPRPDENDTERLAEWTARMSNFTVQEEEPELEVALAPEKTLDEASLQVLAESAAVSYLFTNDVYVSNDRWSGYNLSLIHISHMDKHADYCN